MIARGDLTYITELKRKHVDNMLWWGKHDDPLFYSYNFPSLGKAERDHWYVNKKYAITKRCFSVWDMEHKLIGYISLRNIGWIKKVSELGIVFDPNRLNKGYGTDSLKSFLKYYFDTMKMKKLTLKVATFNKRAENCYEKCGFRVEDIIYDEFEDQNLLAFEDGYLKDYQHILKKQGTILKTSYKYMCITKEIYLQQE
ncbi:MAG: GNAT family N-acetyltransferase [Clostridiaceae bacterium]|nr:GNAT family N-acetyltransferase [Clostridiaceae bacterium]